MLHFPQRFVVNKRLVCLFVVGRSLTHSMQVPTDFPPFKLAQLLFLLTLIQANDHSRENNHMKRNSCIFYFKILIKSTHTQWASQNTPKKLCSPHLLFSSLSSFQPHISYKPIKYFSYPHHMGFYLSIGLKNRLMIKLEIRVKG